MRKRIIVLLTVLTFFLLNPLFVFSETSKGTQLLIDTAIRSKSSLQVKKILQKYQNSSDYKSVEEYSMSWIRKIIIQGDYDFATDLIFIIIESNIDCDYEDDEAFDLYGELISVYSLKR